MVLAILLGFPSASQVKYSHTDFKTIQANRKQMFIAIEKWDRKELYQLGVFFEGIYDKYKDSSINAAIRCYRLASSSESEYLDNIECYNAAYRLARIYEQGKGIPPSLHRAMIYYYLSDSKHTTSYNSLGNPENNADFQRTRKKYCSPDSTSYYETGNRIDSMVISISPFCGFQGKNLTAELEKLGSYLRQHSSINVNIRIRGDNSIPAAQYSLKVKQFILPALQNIVANRLIDNEGISNERIVQEESILVDQDDYVLTIVLRNKE